MKKIAIVLLCIACLAIGFWFGRTYVSSAQEYNVKSLLAKAGEADVFIISHQPPKDNGIREWHDYSGHRAGVVAIWIRDFEERWGKIEEVRKILKDGSE